MAHHADVPLTIVGAGDAAAFRGEIARLDRIRVVGSVGGDEAASVLDALESRALLDESVKGPVRPSKRTDLRRISGQSLYPVIEFEDGSVYREESADMAATIRAGRLAAKRGRAVGDTRSDGGH